MEANFTGTDNDSKSIPQPSSESFAPWYTQWLLNGLSVIIIAFGLFTFTAILQTKRIPRAVRYLTSFLVLTDALMIVVFIIRYWCENKGLSPLASAILHECGRVCLVTTWLLISIMGLERVVCIFWFSEYAMHSSKVKIITNVSVMSIVVIKLMARYLLLPFAESKPYDFVTLTFQPGYLHWILAACLCVTIVCFCAVLSEIKRKTTSVSGMTPSNRQTTNTRWLCTNSVMIFTLLFVIPHVPVFAIKAFWTKSEVAQAIWRTCILSIGLVMCLLHPVLFVWRFQECRYVLKKMLSKYLVCINKALLEQTRVRIYDIVTWNNIENS